MIDGRDLRDTLHKYKYGTKFKCVGHWEERDYPYYTVGGTYTLKEDPESPGMPILLLDGATEYFGSPSRGNGYSGMWKLLSLDDKKLEDYL